MNRFLSALVLVLLWCGLPQAATYYVTTSGGAAASCTNNTTNACTYARAQTVASSGDTILVSGGTYTITSTWTLSKSGVTWRAASGELPVLDGAEAFPTTFYGVLVAITGDDIVFDGFDVRRSKARGVEIKEDADRVIVRNCKIHHNWMQGYLISSPNVVIQGTVNPYNTDAILEYCDIYQNEMRKYYYDNPSLRPDADWNYNSPWGAQVSIVGGYRTIIRHNNIYQSHFEGLGLYRDAERVLVENNYIYGNARLQVYLSSSRYCTVRNNVIYGTTAWNGSVSAAGICGLWMAGETARSDVTRDIGHIAYGNFVANSNKGHWNAGEGYSAVRNSRIFNNLFVEALDRDGVDGIGVQVQSNTGDYGTGNIFKDNAILQSLNTVATILESGRVTFSYNLWSRAPAAAAQGTGDVTNTFALAQSFTSAHPGGSLDEDDFGITSSATLYQAKGTWLTTTSSAVTTSASVPVADASYFYGDEQIKFANGVTTTIQSISGNTLTVSPAVTVPTGNGVHLLSFTAGSTPNIGPWTTGGTTAPSTPTGLAAGTPTASMCTLTWTASTGATGYRIQYGPTSTFPDTGSTTVESTGTSATLYTLTANTGYSARILAYNDTGSSSYSTAVTFTTAAFSQGDVLSLANFTSMTGWTASGGEDWTNGACTDDSDTLYCHAERTVSATIPDELTLSFTVDVDAQPDTFATGGGTGRFVGAYFDTGTRRLGFYQADDGLYISVGTAYTLIPGTATLTDTSAHTWTLLLRRNPDGTTPWLADIYSGETLEVSSYACGRLATGTSGQVSIDVRGTASDNATGTFTNLYISNGHSPPVTIPTHTTAWYAADDCGDVKTGTPTITIVDGVGTFSDEQTSADIIPGFQVDFGAGNTQCYVSEIISPAVYRLVDPDGDICAAVSSQTVNYFRPPFVSLSALESGITGAGYLNGADLTALDVDVKIVLGSMTEGNAIVFDAFSATSATCGWELYAHTPGAYTISRSSGVLLRVDINDFWIHDINLTHTGTAANYARALYVNTSDAAVVSGKISGLKLRGYVSNNYGAHIGISNDTSGGAAGSVIRVWNCDADGYAGGTGSGAYNNSDADVEMYLYHCTAGPNNAIGFTATKGSPQAVCCLSVATDPYSGTWDATKSHHNLSSGTDAPGTDETESATVTFANAATLDFSLSPTADAVAAAAGTDLSEDLHLPVTTDKNGAAYGLGGLYSVGAYASPVTAYELITDLGVQGDLFGFGPQAVFTITPNRPIACDSFVITVDEEAEVTDADCSDTSYQITLTPGSYTVRGTASKAGMDDDYEEVTIKVLQSDEIFYYGDCSGADGTDAASLQWLYSYDAMPKMKWCGNYAVDFSDMLMFEGTTPLVMECDDCQGAITAPSSGDLAIHWRSFRPAGDVQIGSSVTITNRRLPRGGVTLGYVDDPNYWWLSPVMTPVGDDVFLPGYMWREPTGN